MLAEHMEKPVFVVNPNVITLLVGESARYLPFTTGFLKGTGKGVHFSCLVDVVGAVDLHSVVIFVMFTDLVFVGYEFPIGATP
jgi:hypothetical protein